MRRRSRWDIFCHVVDNYGDIGVCWRLARQLVAEHGLTIRLWVSDLASFRALAPEVDPVAAAQSIAGVEVRRWDTPLPAVEPAEVVIEAFACELPETYVQAMARQAVPPLWINLEYLSAEPWIDSHHGLPSPHPRWPLNKYFFFPGFSPQSGGLLREAGLIDARRRHQDMPGARAAFWRTLALTPPEGALIVSLFGYPNPALADLLTAWAAGPRPIFCVLPKTPLADQAAAALGITALCPGTPFCRGALTVALIPFLPQPDYDRLLWSCDLNFVRGEDSLVRALWAARPFVWHIYPQHDAAHDAKLEAFLDRYCAGLPTAPAAALRDFAHGWNGRGGIGAAWPHLHAVLPALAAHALARCAEWAQVPDLATQLVKFSEMRL